jgi:hypothetical protein
MNADLERLRAAEFVCGSGKRSGGGRGGWRVHVAYPTLLLFLCGAALCFGLQAALRVVLGQSRLNLWIAIFGFALAGYSFAGYRLSLVQDPSSGGVWQINQLLFGSVMLLASLFFGLEHLGRLSRGIILKALLPAIALDVVLQIPGIGMTSTPSVKVVKDLGVTYQEVVPGLGARLFFAATLLVIVAMLTLLVQRAWRGTTRDRVVAFLFVLLYGCGLHDMLIAEGLLRSLYILEPFSVAFLALIQVVLPLGSRAGAERARGPGRNAREVREEMASLLASHAVARLASGVAHEVNNPLTFVVGNLEMLENELVNDEELVSLARGALTGARRIQRVVEVLENGEKQPGSS